MKRTTVILAAGEFPRKGTPARRALDGASRVVCCDSAADAYRRRTGREPTVVVGDCDSVKGRFAKVVRVDEQETNDLEKAIRYCAQRGWKDPVLLGVMGKREDHALGNLFRGMEHGLEIVTDRGRFIPLGGAHGTPRIAPALQLASLGGYSRPTVLHVSVGAAVSIFATPGTRMTSTGLVWPLDGVRFENFYCATLNRANARRVTLTTSKRAYAYLVEK